MFPSFKNLQDRRNKLKQLAAENALDLEIDRIKDEAYKNTIWATDESTTFDISKLLQMTKQNFASMKNEYASVSSQTDLPPRPPPSSSVEVQATSSVSDMGMMAIPDIEDLGIQVSPSTATVSIQTSPVTPTVGIQTSMTEGGTQVETDDLRAQRNARNSIIDQYTINPSIIKRKVNPIKISGNVDTNVYIGAEGKLYNTGNDKPSKRGIYNYDWVATNNYIKNIAERAVEEAEIGTDIPSGFNIESGSYEVLVDILQNNNFPEEVMLPIPYKKGTNRSGQPIPLNNSYRVNLIDGVLKIADGNKIKPNVGSLISWNATLEKYIDYLKQNGISFKQSAMFKSSKTANLDSTMTPVNPDQKIIDTVNENAKSAVIDLFNNNDWLIDEKIFLKPKKGSAGKFAKYTYYLGDFASIMHKKGNQIPEGRKNRIEENIDWVVLLDDITKKYGNRLESGQVQIKSANPNRFRGRPLDVSLDSKMSGMGLSSNRGRRSALKHEFDKLQGARGLGVDNRNLERELRLIRRAF